MQKGLHRIFIDVPLTHTSLQSYLSHKYSAVKISLCQEGCGGDEEELRGIEEDEEKERGMLYVAACRPALICVGVQ